MKRFRVILLVVAAGIILAELIIIDYSTFSIRNGAGNYLVIISMILLIISLLLSTKEERKKDPGK